MLDKNAVHYYNEIVKPKKKGGKTMKLSEKWKNLLGKSTKTVWRFRLPVIFLILAYILSLVMTFSEVNDPPMVYLVLTAWLGAYVAAFFRLFVERFGEKFATLSFVIRDIVPIAYTVLWYILLLHFDENYHTVLILGGLTAAMALLGMYVFAKNDKTLVTGAETVKAVFMAAAVALVFLVGMFICLGAVELLIVSIPYSVSSKLMACIFFGSAAVGSFTLFAYLPNVFHKAPEEQAEAEPSEKSGTGGVFRAIFALAELPVFLLLLGILIVYFLKILFTLRLPEGGINLYAIIADIVFLFNVFAVTAYAEHTRIVAFFRKFGAFLMLPVLGMQTLAVGVRIAEYGLTAPRVLSFILVAITAVFAVGLFARKVDIALLVSTAVILVFTVTPLNFIDLPVYQQTASLKSTLIRNGMFENGKILPGEPLSAKDARKIVGAYDYITAYPDAAPDWLDTKRSAENFEKQFGFSKYGWAESVYVDVRERTRVSNVPLGETPFDISSYRFIDHEELWSANGDDLVYHCKVEDDSSYKAYDLMGYVEEMRLAYGDSWNDEALGVIALDEQVDFYLDFLSAEWNTETKTYEDIQLRGYFLIK